VKEHAALLHRSSALDSTTCFLKQTTLEYSAATSTREDMY